MRKLTIAAGLALLVAACASSETARVTPLPAQPTETEVRDYVAAHWEGDYDAWVPKSMKHEKAKNALVSVSKLSCRPYYAVWYCDFEIAGRFDDEVAYTRVATSQFERKADGSLQKTLLFVEPRRR